MKIRSSVLLTCAAMALCSSTAKAALTWDFENGMQGWTWSTASAAFVPGQHIAPGAPPEIVPGTYGAGGGNLYCPGDSVTRSAAVFNLSSYLVGGKTSRFFMQTDVYIPNLRPLTGFPNAYPGMTNQGSGIFAMPTVNDYSVAMYGNPGKGTQSYKDLTADDAWTERKKDWIMEEFTGGSPNVAVSPDTEWWNKWITLQVDFGFTTPGQVTVKANLPWTTYAGQTGWITTYSGAIFASPWAVGGRDFSRLVVGCGNKGTPAPWSKSQYDNVIFDSPDLVPEPSTILALGAGLVGLAGSVRRRKV